MGIGDLFKKRPPTKMRTLYYWECSCGKQSRDGDLSERHAAELAQSHQWRQGVGHPMPTVYSKQFSVPSDFP